jgi:hypothetical protein
MIVPRLATADGSPPPGTARPVAVDQSLDGQVQSALNLYLALKTPAQMPALVKLLQESHPSINAALSSLDYVHFARFLPTPDGSALWVLTVYDGDLEPYVLDFVVVLGDVFTEVLYFIKDAPRLPVQKHPRDFVDFVRKNNLKVGDWSAYPQQTVIDIRRKFGLS